VKLSSIIPALLTTLVLSPAFAGSIDMDDPRRTVGREDNVRVDAQLVKDTVSPGAVIGVAWQIENLSNAPVAVAEKVADATYDDDTKTITIALGAEVPVDGKMPQLAFVKPGEKKTFRSGATPQLSPAATRSSHAAPRYVQVKVSILRDIAPFASMRAEQLLPDDLFDKWFEANDSIFLNAVPVHFSRSSGSSNGFTAADQRGGF
jgi:hypothetical protein